MVSIKSMYVKCFATRELDAAFLINLISNPVIVVPSIPSQPYWKLVVSFEAFEACAR